MPDVRIGVEVLLGRAARRRTVALLALAGLTPILLGCADASVQRQASAAQSLDQVGLTHYAASSRAMAATIDGPTLAGAQFTLSSVIGDVVVVNVWASWCGPCRAESPALARASAHFAGQPVRFVGVDEQDGSEQAKAFVTSTGATYPVLVDSEGKLLARLRVLPQAAVPSTLVLDRRGRIADRVIGPVTEAQITSLVSAVLAKS
jgi:thiol-disulfide isomerase/thioredoxin